MTSDNRNELGRIIKQRRVMIPLTQRELATKSGVSSSYLGRIEQGTRLPSAGILRKIAEPLGFDEGELFMLAGFFSHRSPTIAGNGPACSGGGRLDPYVASVLSQEPVEVQRAIIGILSILKSIAK